jgi:hypothetical protein
MEPEGSIPNSQELSNCPYPEPDQSSRHHPSHLYQIHLNIVQPPTSWSSYWPPFLLLSHQEPIRVTRIRKFRTPWETWRVRSSDDVIRTSNHAGFSGIRSSDDVREAFQCEVSLLACSTMAEGCGRRADTLCSQSAVSLSFFLSLPAGTSAGDGYARQEGRSDETKPRQCQAAPPPAS